MCGRAGAVALFMWWSDALTPGLPCGRRLCKSMLSSRPPLPTSHASARDPCCPVRRWRPSHVTAGVTPCLPQGRRMEALLLLWCCTVGGWCVLVVQCRAIILSVTRGAEGASMWPTLETLGGWALLSLACCWNVTRHAAAQGANVPWRSVRGSQRRPQGVGAGGGRPRAARWCVRVCAHCCCAQREVTAVSQAALSSRSA